MLYAMRIFTFYILQLCLIVGVASAQKLSIGLKSGLGVQFYNREATTNGIVPVSTWGSYEQPFYTSYTHYRVGVSTDYQFKPYLKPRLEVYFSQRTSNEGSATGTTNQGQPDGSTVAIARSSTFKVNEWNIMPGIALDALYKNQNEALNLLLALNLGWRSQIEIYREEVDTSNFTYQKFASERSGVFVAFALGLEWEEYFSEHFGYSIGVEYQLPYTFTPSSFTVRDYILDYDNLTARQGDYKYSDDQQEPIKGRVLKEENFYLQNAYINLGVRYRF